MEIRGFDNFAKFRNENSFIHHLLMEVLGSNKGNKGKYNTEDIFGKDIKKFDMGITINGIELDANSFLTLLETTFNKWEDNYATRVKKDVEKYIKANVVPTKAMGSIEQDLFELSEAFEGLKNKIECLDTSISWNEKALTK
jgi:hypothetical protein